MADSSLPPPPPSAPLSAEPSIVPDEQPAPAGLWIRPPRAGELTPAWRGALVVTWALGLLAFLAVWKVSEELGLATWWLGPLSQPQPVIVRLVPTIVCIVFGAWCTLPVRRVPVIAVAGAIVLGAISIPDFSRAVGIATIELTIAGAVALVALAAFSGIYRAAR